MKQIDNINIVSTVNSSQQTNDLFNVFMVAIEIDYANVKLAHDTGMAIELISPTFDILYNFHPQRSIISEKRFNYP